MGFVTIWIFSRIGPMKSLKKEPRSRETFSNCTFGVPPNVADEPPVPMVTSAKTWS